MAAKRSGASLARVCRKDIEPLRNYQTSTTSPMLARAFSDNMKNRCANYDDLALAARGSALYLSCYQALISDSGAGRGVLLERFGHLE
jgi:hypothetical protein